LERIHNGSSNQQFREKKYSEEWNKVSWFGV
jgi:hypothetical protein